MKSAENIQQQIKQNKPGAQLSPSMDRRILADSIAAMQSARQTNKDEDSPHPIRRLIMHSKISKFAAAAVLLAAIGFLFVFFNQTIQPVTAAQLLGQAITAANDIHTIHIKARMRTLPADNFMHLDLDLDFVPIEMWGKFVDGNFIQMRIDKPQRVISIDNGKAVMIIRNEFVSQGNCPSYACYDSGWLSRLMLVNHLLASELHAAAENENRSISVYHEKGDGQNYLVLERFSPANVGKDDYLRNKFIRDADRTLTYTFDPETKRLRGFQILVHTDEKDVLAFEITDIEYNPSIEDDYFTLELPPKAAEFTEPQILPDNEKYENMTPRQAAEGFFTACAQENWDEVLRYFPMTAVPQPMKQYLGGLEIISLGESFQSAGSSSWFVPYEIKLKDGSVKKHNLALKRLPPADRWIVDGGF